MFFHRQFGRLRPAINKEPSMPAKAKKSAASAVAAVDKIADVAQLDDMLSEPTDGAVKTLAKYKGDIMIVGVGGKVGPSLARMVVRASEAAGTKRRIMGVSLNYAPGVEEDLNKHGIETLTCDLLNEGQLAKMPDAPIVIYMAGMKFGSSGAESLTWAMNAYLPGMVTQKYRKSRISAFSTGNIYGLTPVNGRGSVETDPANPLGDYAQSCLGRERIFDHFSRVLKVPVTIVRLNYAVEMRYGILYDLATQVWAGKTVDLTMGNCNVIWQGDSNAMVIQSLDLAASPPYYLNVSGPEILRVREVCETYGKLMGKKVSFKGKEAETALINNGEHGHGLFGKPRVPVSKVIEWTADWVMRGGVSLGKPTHFDVRDGKF
jgi:hypothetical protein